MDNRRLLALVADYKGNHRSSSRAELRFFREMPSLELAIHHAAFALDGRTPPRRYAHQRRIRMKPMRLAYAAMSASATDMRNAETFDALHELLSQRLLPIQGLGRLYVYDTALRLGAHLRRHPRVVYLHAGTRVGATALGLGPGLYLEKRALPKPLQELDAHELEDFLCIYADALTGAPWRPEKGSCSVRRRRVFNRGC
jgi:hypothetical protein